MYLNNNNNNVNVYCTTIIRKSKERLILIVGWINRSLYLYIGSRVLIKLKLILVYYINYKIA
nr:MAG TPA: hypothetical protein [Caudoviricetes sp.]